MFNSPYYKVLFSVLAIFFAFNFYAQTDRVYSVKITEKGMPTKDGELYLKSNNTISGTFSKELGFPEAAYVLAQDSTTQRNVQTFTAECTNPKKHTLKWSGKINGLTIQGKAQHYFMGKIGGEYLFTGTLKP